MMQTAWFRKFKTGKEYFLLCNGLLNYLCNPKGLPGNQSKQHRKDSLKKNIYSCVTSGLISDSNSQSILQ